jgi:hypothetical protein
MQMQMQQAQYQPMQMQPSAKPCQRSLSRMLLLVQHQALVLGASLTG